MDLSYKDLKKREVINVADARSFGHLTDIVLKFPDGVLTAITVPGRKTNCLSRLFDKTEIYIDVNKILKIGNDVILVDLKCGDVCYPNSKAVSPKRTPCGCGDIFGGSDVKSDGDE